MVCSQSRNSPHSTEPWTTANVRNKYIKNVQLHLTIYSRNPTRTPRPKKKTNLVRLITERIDKPCTYFSVKLPNYIVDKKNQLDVTFCILYFSSNICSTGQFWNEPIHGRTTYQPDLTTFLQPRHMPTRGYNITQSSAADDGHMVTRNMLSSY